MASTKHLGPTDTVNGHHLTPAEASSDDSFMETWPDL